MYRYRLVCCIHLMHASGRFFFRLIFAAWCWMLMFSSNAPGQSNVAPLVEYRFNETGVEAKNTGLDATPLLFKNASSIGFDLHSVDGAGVSGLEGDRAFDNSGSTAMGNAGVGGVGEAAPLPVIHGLI